STRSSLLGFIRHWSCSTSSAVRGIAMPPDAEQLTLFKGRHRKSVVEFKLHCVLADFLRRWINPAWRYTHLPMGEHRTKETAARLKRMGVTPGWPDFIFVGPGAFVFWLELKRARTGRLSDEQLAVRAHLMRCGFAYLVTSSVDEAVSTLQDFNILPRSIHVQ